MYARIRQYLLHISLVVVLLCFVLAVNGFASAQQKETATAELVKHISSLASILEEELPSTPTRADGLRRVRAHQGMSKSAKEIAVSGPSARAEIYPLIRDTSVPSSVRIALLKGLQYAKGDDAHLFLLEIACNVTELSEAAMRALAGNAQLIQRITVVPTDAQLKQFITLVNEGPYNEAVTAAPVLGALQGAPLEQRLDPVRRWFLRLCTSPPVGAGSIFREAHLKGAVTVFASFGESARVPLRKALDTATGDELTRKWLLLALGHAGDPLVAGEVRALVNNTAENVSLRSAAVSAYTASAGEGALPDLELWSKDLTKVVDDMHKQETFPIAETAQFDLTRLRAKIKSKNKK